MTDRPDITPRTRVGAFLEAWPELTETRIGLAPEFARLRNPVLRRTVGRVATLARAAKLAGLDRVVLTNRLREAAGLDPLPGERAAEAGGDETPASVDEVRVGITVDADATLESGGNPLSTVRAALADLERGEALRSTSSFRPVPLGEALGTSYRVATRRREDGHGYETLVTPS